jgi:hypothetical protein
MEKEVIWDIIEVEKVLKETQLDRIHPLNLD